MSGIEDRNGELGELAFEYVAGTLSTEERQRFEARLQASESLADEVRFWEEQLMTIQAEQGERAPLPGNWDAIEQRIQAPSSQKDGWFAAWFWKFATGGFALAWILTIGIFLSVDRGVSNSEPNADYVAVLTSSDGQALLTALTSDDGASLWLKWDEKPNLSESSVQLWAQSRRDGQIRPLFVFDSLQDTLSLDEATYRLIRDSSYLLLTEEEQGGSAIDEPSDILLAKGVCVRLQERAG